MYILKQNEVLISNPNIKKLKKMILAKTIRKDGKVSIRYVETKKPKKPKKIKGVYNPKTKTRTYHL